MLERIQHASGLVAYRSPALRALGVPNLFTTRIGPQGALLDLVSIDTQTHELLAECGGFAPAAPIVSLRQVHGSEVHEIDAQPPEQRDDGDAAVSARPDRTLLVYTADCVPVLIASANGERVGAIHAGWRGLIAGVIPRAVLSLGAIPAAAAIGPCLSLEHCEMGPEVADLFVSAGLGEAVVHRAGRKPHVDLRAAARLQLERAGARTIDVSRSCTYRDFDEMPSHRRDVTHGGASRAGRIGALIAARPRA